MNATALGPAAVIAWLAIGIATVVGCSSSDDTHGNPSDSGVDAASSQCASSCDDGFACTIDTCNAGSCAHSIGPNSGATACSAGHYCTLDAGCVAAPACATADQCTQYWAGDACKANIKCEAASSVCTFSILDKDGDGYAPQVCGGGDCNDADSTVHPGAVETCNGVDDNCNGEVDEPGNAISEQCGATSECKSGRCTCKPENLCGTTCVDSQVNVEHCGSCDHSCGTNAGASAGWGSWSCAAGACSCPADTCGTICTSLQQDGKNCGVCGQVCGTDERCRSGVCTPVHVCTKNSGICESNQFCRSIHTANNLGGIGVGCTTSMCDCPDYTYSCGQVSDWEFECYPS